MKTNTPEKIYVHKTEILGLLAASEINITGNDIEYTRTDAVIEKVCDYLKSLTYQEYPGGPLERMINDECIENLKKEFE